MALYRSLKYSWFNTILFRVNEGQSLGYPVRSPWIAGLEGVLHLHLIFLQRMIVLVRLLDIFTAHLLQLPTL